MIRGMSGFGQARAENDKLKVLVQVRTLNHRYLDCTVYMPETLRSLESDIKAIVKKKIKRGKVTVFVDIIHKVSSQPHLNPQAVSVYMRLAKKLHKEFGVAEHISFAQIVGLPSVLESRSDTALDNAATKHPIFASLAQAVEKTVLMRGQEGGAIYTDLAKRLKIIKAKIDYIEQKLPKVFALLGKKMTQDELNSFMRGCDISEEIVRLKFHLNNCLRTASAKGSEPKGKELDFILQELQREANTLGAKVPDKHVSAAVVKIKSQLEKLREQIQNVE
jgi:uncharacterized protein (TIGR00255 family)